METAPVVEDGVHSPSITFYTAAEVANAKWTFVQCCPLWLILITALKGGSHFN